MNAPVLRWFGTGPPLVLVHGWGAGPEMLSPWVERLASDWRVGVVTLPGHGGSPDAILDPASIAGCVSALLPSATTWAGWSLGAQVVLYAARYHGDMVRAAALLAATPRFCPATDWPWGVPPSRLRAMRRGLQVDPRAVVARFGVDVLGTRMVLSGVGARALRSGLDCLERGDMRALLPGIGAPLRWIVGDRDPLVSVGAVRAAAALTRHAGVRVLSGAGHAPFLDRADGISEELRILNSVSGSRDE